MGVRLEGKPVVQALRVDIKQRVSQLGEQGMIPAILIIRVGVREDDLSYEKGILKNCELLGIKSVVKGLPADITMGEITAVIEAANKDDSIHGIMLFRPLPENLDFDIIKNVIDPAKDIDCMSPVNLENVFEGNLKGFVPCTPQAVIELLKYYNIPMNGARVVVAGRSLVVGKPLAMLLLNENATVTICHSRTKNMPSVTAQADIVVAAIGKAKFMKDEFFTRDSIVVDVGINEDDDGKICGDVDYDQVFDKVKAITPAVGGVGTITTTILLNHVVQACEAALKG
ncbi:MAG TPA: bifunctional 5,10-methylenetetrahydrofolate dehydrogenase/5,10-methenyltetrahydrofolate cyclohydrolase [Clostridia bacterium]|nr:bifunctional 5,10-methylenetetrahydrofolate dehydrogenase/5,10-methenyltetrahydrofolate cyclohydrolase [Clostridia bacterium]